MSKANMVVLSLLSVAPMHGYQIGNLVDHFGLPHWTGITLPAIYKAIQALEKGKHISGKEMREGNNPPRVVYELRPKGKEHLREILRRRLFKYSDMDKDWWLALIFAHQALTRTEMLQIVNDRIRSLDQVAADKKACRDLSWPGQNQGFPFVHKHLVALGQRYCKAERKSLEELLDDIKSGGHEDFFASEGEQR